MDVLQVRGIRLNKTTGLSAVAFHKVLRESKMCCPAALRALKGKTLAQFWRTTRKGPWMAWWLYEFLDVRFDDLSSAVPSVQFSTAKGFENFEASMAKGLRAAFNFDGTRKESR